MRPGTAARLGLRSPDLREPAAADRWPPFDWDAALAYFEDVSSPVHVPYVGFDVPVRQVRLRRQAFRLVLLLGAVMFAALMVGMWV